MDGIKEVLGNFLDWIDPYTTGISLFVIAIFWILMAIKIEKVKKHGSAEEKILQKNMIIAGASAVNVLITLFVVLNVALYIIKIIKGDIENFKSIDIDLVILAAFSAIFYFSSMLSLKKYENNPAKKKKLMEDYAKMAKSLIDDEEIK
ncbi:hypothetical protein [Miniphocaeibacter massiliensis]|uniref:hypothetical protein n=1 Tax=Miniphocaeibacter massiliensis TaxID=2041841 RepID=UPI000C08D464|nr:hypothetical protein [Miniphocaeibacter massiliensis]